MTLKKAFFYVILFFGMTLYAQKKDQVLFTIDNEPITVGEFERVYKKNIDLVTDKEQKKVGNYLDLFVDYKLKLKEAQRLGYDTIPTYKRELKTYKNQIANQFIKDTKVTDKLVKEAYDRTVKEVNASHILLRLKPNALPVDTLKAYNKLLDIKKRIEKGEDFVALAKEYSQDPSVKDNGGNLGYFNAFRMVYPFETATYNTKKGGVSNPFKTQFGYHIVKVNDVRSAKGDVEVSHIMLKGTTAEQKKRIDEMYSKLKNGADFSFYATKFSEDKATAKNGGKMKRFGSGQMIKPFEDSAYNLQNVGDISIPFKSQFGYHIIKLLAKHNIPSFDEMQSALKAKVQKDGRSRLIADNMNKKLEALYDITVNDDVAEILFHDHSKENHVHKNVDDNATLITVNGDKLVPVGAYTKPLQRRRQTPNAQNFEQFLQQQRFVYHKDNLEKVDTEFAQTINEYRDGLLLFSLLQNNIWDKANDSTALKDYFENNKANYQHKKRVVATIATTKSKTEATKLQAFLTKGMNLDEASDIDTKNFIFSNGTYEVDSNKLPKEYEPKVGTSKIYKDGKHYIVVNVSKVLGVEPKVLSEVKGNVISDYQSYLEQQMVAKLRKQHKINIDKRVLKKLKRKYR